MEQAELLKPSQNLREESALTAIYSAYICPS